ncbi:hypothetical protein FBY40_0814 [Microbacterium sp. SLBN-154]|uniref:hypothetical protein n=1 Tax=Microbacterium sp. SLBN-154 TaxID=2768458 RepID=UPI00114F2831|nr:hypothetical protein [Microbacterium sp. SLBN-154]TQK18327.1 hypothetical protein FBY40_0814 [Microbacterium sp. SLBN-154]
MRSRLMALPGVLICGAVMAACTGGPPEPPETPPAVTGDPAARAQAAAWLDAAALPPGAVRSDAGVAEFLSFTGWPCTPVEELEGYWAVPESTVAETANWLLANPTADLVTTGIGPYPDDSELDNVTVGYIPAEGSQEGVVYTVVQTADGVAVRAEVAALTESAVCPELPDGGTLGPPGQG